MTRTDPESRKQRCPVCDAREIYHRRTGANGGYGPRLLPGLGRFLKSAEMDVYLCAECGHLQFFADEQARQRVRDTYSWRRLK